MFRKTIPLIAIVASLATLGTPFAAYADNVFHYACKGEDARYALTVNTSRGVVKMLERRAPYTLTTFRILKTATGECGKGGWILNGATFCYATQGVGTLTWHGHELDCDQADTE